MWFTMTVPKAAKGQGEERAESAAFARRIQCARVEKGIVSVSVSSAGSGGLALGLEGGREPWVRWMRVRRRRLRIERG